MTISVLVLTSCAYGALLIRLIYHPSAWGSKPPGFVTQCINSFANIIFAYVYYPAHVHVQH